MVPLNDPNSNDVTQLPPLDPQVKLPSVGKKYSAQDKEEDGRAVVRKEVEHWARQCRPPLTICVKKTNLKCDNKITIYGDENSVKRFENGTQLVNKNDEKCPWSIRIEKQDGHRWKVMDINNHHTQSCIRSRLGFSTQTQSDHAGSREIQAIKRENNAGRRLNGPGSSQAQSGSKHHIDPESSSSSSSSSSSEEEGDVQIIPPRSVPRQHLKNLAILGSSPRSAPRRESGRSHDIEEQLHVGRRFVHLTDFRNIVIRLFEEKGHQDLFAQNKITFYTNRYVMRATCLGATRNCPFLIHCKPDGPVSARNGWILFDFNLDHNHDIGYHPKPTGALKRGRSSSYGVDIDELGPGKSSRRNKLANLSNSRKKQKRNETPLSSKNARAKFEPILTPEISASPTASSSRAAGGHPVSKYAKTPLFNLLRQINPSYTVWVDPLVTAGADPNHPEELIRLPEDCLMDAFGAARRQLGEGEVVFVENEGEKKQGDWIKMPPVLKFILKGNFRERRKEI